MVETGALDGGGTMNDTRLRKRKEMARQILRDPETFMEAIVWGLLANVVIAQKGNDSTDAEMFYQMVQMWDRLAGVTDAELA